MDETVIQQIILLLEALKPHESIEFTADKDGKIDTFVYKRWDRGIITPKK